MRFKYYVLNYDFNSRKIKPFNIFDNCLVNEHTEKLVKKYLRSPKKFSVKRNGNTLTGFEAFCDELRSIIMWQEWSRCEYEIFVSGWSNGENPKKIDCYQQALPNIEMISREVIYQYKQNKKENS